MSEKQQKIDLDKYLGGFFKAEDMAKEKEKIVIGKIREADLPNSGPSLILDFNYKEKEKSLPLNKTNLKVLRSKFGINVEKWEGKEIILIKVLTTNPKTRKEVESLRIK